MADVLFSNHSSIFLVRPVSDGAREWTERYVDIQPYMRVGDAFAVEHRYVGDILAGLRDEGFTIAECSDATIDGR